MAWETRQNRLRDLLTAQKPYVFQLVAFFDIWPIPLGMSMDLIKQHGLNFQEIDRFDFPKTQIGSHEFDGGYIAQRSSKLQRAQSVYTSYPYPEKDIPLMEADSMIIRKIVMDSLDEQCPDHPFKVGFFSRDEGLVFDFGYFIDEYDPKIHALDNMGAIKPLKIIPEVIPDHVRVPEQRQFVNFEPYRHRYPAPVIETVEPEQP